MTRRKSPAKDVSFSQFQGVNNVQAPERLDLKELREALNVDIDDSGRLRRRDGFTKVYTGTNCHSFWANDAGAYFVEEGSLQRLNADFSSTVLRTGLQINQKMSFVSADDGAVYYSDGIHLGKISGDGTAWLPMAAFYSPICRMIRMRITSMST
jgi:hypothetical protein